MNPIYAKFLSISAAYKEDKNTLHSLVNGVDAIQSHTDLLSVEIFDYYCELEEYNAVTLDENRKPSMREKWKILKVVSKIEDAINEAVEVEKGTE